MVRNSILVKGNKDGLNVIINMEAFKDFEDMIESLIKKLSRGKKFYKGTTLRITTQLKYINERELRKLKNILFDEFLIKDCIFEDLNEKSDKVFSGIYEGRTKFIRRSIRSGQIVNYPGNLVIIGDVSPGAEVSAGGNIIVLGVLKGCVNAGSNGNTNAVIAAFKLQPQIIQIANLITRAPEDEVKPQYPEVARIKGESIVVEPYLPNKFI
ncbi:septum site-determining protein MinC [Clostridium sp. KNHs214]|uniref:septum site-determining protein MinC n=1 Tax=Clostridium sp. KNHs214 TaxID=1540257 RepID=UPI00054EE3E4|nr:septum site-determining protein MinC [Clostridium sp. KNHs214]